MAETARKAKKRRLRYFYIKVEGDLHLHKVLFVNRAQDLVWAWDYVEHGRRMYVFSDVLKTMQHAFSVTEVAEILGRHRMTIDGYIREEKIQAPQRIYDLEGRTPGKYFFSEDDVLGLHDYLSEKHIGNPRKDGLTSNKLKMNKSELRALVQQGQVLYTTDEKGNFVPIWKEQVW